MKLRVTTLLDGGATARLIETFRGLRFALHGQARGIAAVVALSTAAVLLELARPWPIKVVLDNVLVGESAPAGAGRAIAIAAGAVLTISILLAVTAARSQVKAAQVARYAASRLRRRIFEHLHRLEVPFHRRARAGDLLVRLMGDVNMVRDLLFASWISMLQRGMLLLGVSVVLFVLDPVVGLLAVAPLPLLWLSLSRSTGRLRRVVSKQRRREDDVASMAAESLRQISLVKAYAGEQDAAERFGRHTRSSERAGVRAIRIAAHMAGRTEIVTGLGTALVLFVGAHMVLRRGMTIGELVVLVSYVRMMYKPLRTMTKEGGRLSKAAACGERLLDLLVEEPEPHEGEEPPARIAGAIEFRSVSYSYPDGPDALVDASLAIPAGSLAVLAGENGSGKSTLLAILLRLQRPDDGTVLIDGEPIDRWQLDSYRRRFAYVPQAIEVFAGSIADNIRYGAPDATDAQVEAAARAALADRFIEHLPDGFDTPVGEGGATLSGGQARRLMLARAAVREASIMLLDEPLAGLDPHTRRTVARAIRSIARGRTTLVVNHGPSWELEPDLIVSLHAGRVRDVVPSGLAELP